MPVSSASSPEVAAGSIATTILARCGAKVWGVASIIEWLHNAPGVSSRSSALSSCRPSRVPSYLRMIWSKNPGARLAAIFVGRPPRYRNVTALAGEQFADQPCRPRRRCHQAAWVTAQSQPELQHVPCLGSRPRTKFIAYRGVVLGTAQAFRLLGTEGCRHGPIRPGKPPFRGFVTRPEPGRGTRQ